MTKPLNVRFFELRTLPDGTRLTYPLDFEYNPNTGKISCPQAHPSSQDPLGPLIWCEHMGPAVNTGSDAEAIWEPIEVSDAQVYADQMLLDIPMFPTVDLWATVTLTLRDNTAVPMYVVEWSHPDGPDDQFIGNITPGEGRRTIREMLVEFMWAAPDRDDACQASHHGVNAQAMWEKAIEGPNRTREAWSIYVNGWCTYCNLHKGDDSDLIPLAERAGVWS